MSVGRLSTANSLMIMNDKLTRFMTLIDLYSGAGGLSLGFSRVFNPDQHIAVETDRNAIQTHRKNFGSVGIGASVADALDDLYDADIVIGGPPCQGFSVLNPYRNDRDRRNQEWVQFLNVVEKTKPRAFVIENVPAIMNTPVLASIIERGTNCGYRMTHSILAAAHYGAPTTRRRIFIVGMQDMVWDSPRPTHGDQSGSMFTCSDIKPFNTVKDAISDLPPAMPKNECSITMHHFSDSERNRSRCALIPPTCENRLVWLRTNHPELICPTYRKRDGKFFPSAYGKMSWNKLAPAITTQFLEASSGAFTHPDGMRAITLREAARLQTFPDDFVFEGSDLSIAKQIGNAVPPVLGASVAASIAAKLCL